MREGTVRANGIEFATIEEGDGPVVLLMHGFPDVAQTWTAQMRALADAGYRAIAVNSRGYPPTEIPADGFYDGATLAVDVNGFHRAREERLLQLPRFFRRILVAEQRQRRRCDGRVHRLVQCRILRIGR